VVPERKGGAMQLRHSALRVTIDRNPVSSNHPTLSHSESVEKLRRGGILPNKERMGRDSK